jgi:hypothetical protein
LAPACLRRRPVPCSITSVGATVPDRPAASSASRQGSSGHPQESDKSRKSHQEAGRRPLTISYGGGQQVRSPLGRRAACTLNGP